MTWFKRWFGSREPTPTICDLDAASSVDAIEQVIAAGFDGTAPSGMEPHLCSDEDIKRPVRRIQGELGRRLALLASI